MDQLLFKTFGLDMSKAKTNEFYDIDLKISGNFYESFDITILRAINITFEYDYCTGGFFIL